MDFYFHILNGLLFPYSKWTFISFRFISYSILCTLIFFIPFHSFLFLSIPFYNFLFYYFLFFSPFRSQSTIGFLPIFFQDILTKCKVSPSYLTTNQNFLRFFPKFQDILTKYCPSFSNLTKPNLKFRRKD